MSVYRGKGVFYIYTTYAGAESPPLSQANIARSFTGVRIRRNVEPIQILDYVYHPPVPWRT